MTELQGEQIFVVNLSKSVARKELVEKSFKLAGIDTWNIFPAVVGNDLEYEDCSQVVSKECFEFTKKAKSRQFHYNHNMGSIGCFMSHYLLWSKLCSQSKYDWFMICEDDNYIAPDFLKKLEKVLKHTNFANRKDIGVLILSWIARPYYSFKEAQTRSPQFKTAFSNGKRLTKHEHQHTKQSEQIILHNREFQGTTCYLVKKSAAEGLMNSCKDANKQLDWWMSEKRVENGIWVLAKPITHFTKLSRVSDINHTPLIK